MEAKARLFPDVGARVAAIKSRVVQRAGAASDARAGTLEGERVVRQTGIVVDHLGQIQVLYHWLVGVVA